MIRAAAKLLLLLSLTVHAGAAPKFAVVRVTEIYRNLSSTTHLQKELQQERDDLLKDERAEQLRKMVADLQDLQTQFQQRKDQPMNDDVRKLARDFEIKRQEAQTLQQEFEIFRTEKNREINRKMVKSMRESLDKITRSANRLAKEQGFEGAFDSSGHSNTGVPVVLYIKNAKDLTNDVAAALKDAGDPPITAEGSATLPSAPKPAPTGEAAIPGSGQSAPAPQPANP